MSSTVFSISLNKLDMAKLEDLQNKYPNLSRNAMIRHIINIVHTRETVDIDSLQKDYDIVHEQLLTQLRKNKR